MAEHENNRTDITNEMTYNRRYVGTRETVAYLFNDFSNAFNINGYKNRFIWDVVKIDFDIMAKVEIFTGVWDVVNDSVIGMFVDKTRTRWGKFRPYLLLLQMPLTLIGMFYWFIPLMFPNTAGNFVPKLIVYFAFNVITETAGTFTSVAKTGYMTTITPNPNERGRLILLAELLTGYMGEDVPGMICGLLLDLINNKILDWKLSSVFISLGVGTSVISAICTLYFFIVTRERVLQKVERPSIKEGIRAILNNKPILLIMLSRLLGGFSISTNTQDYFIDVLGSATLQTVINAPSGFVGSVSYAFVQPLRKRFSSKALWVFEDIYTRSLGVILMLFGLFNKNYMSVIAMSFGFGIQAFFDKCMFGIRKVINAELYNEAMDYCEWKNGYRVEATTGVVYDLILKLQGNLMGSVRNLLLARIGYVQGLDIGTQSDNTKFWMFAMCTGIPSLTGSLSVIPKFFYPLSREKRTQMYNDLHEHRTKVAESVNIANAAINYDPSEILD